MVFNVPSSGLQTNAEPFAMPVVDRKRKALHLTLSENQQPPGGQQQQQPPRKKFAILASPDVKKLASPALEKLLWRNFEAVGTGTTPLITPSTMEFLTAKTPTEAAEFLRGFDEMLQSKKNQGNIGDPNLCAAIVTSEGSRMVNGDVDSNDSNNNVTGDNAMLFGKFSKVHSLNYREGL
jgi:hypothetical protein